MVREKYSILPNAAEAAASPQIRNQGTIGGNVSQDARCWYYRGGWPCYRAGGNICYADTPTGLNREHAILDADRCVAVNPSDTAPALIALDAKMVLRTPKGFSAKSHTLRSRAFFRNRTVTRPMWTDPYRSKRSPGAGSSSGVMSIAGTNEVVLGIDDASPFGVRGPLFASSAIKAGPYRRIDRYTTIGIEDACSRFRARRRICIANISRRDSRASHRDNTNTARPGGTLPPIVPWLRNLRGGGRLSAFGRMLLLLAHHRVAHHFGEGGHCSNFQPIADCANATQLFDLAQVDNNFGPLDTILKPVEAV